MGYYVDWFIPDRCMRTYSWGLVTFDDFVGGAEAMQSLLSQGTTPIHLIADMRHVQAFPTNVIEIIRASELFKSPDWGWVIVVSNDQTVRFLATAATQVWGARYQGFTTINTALNFLQRMDPTLPPIPAYIVREISTAR